MLMPGTIAQVVALSTYGNWFLQGAQESNGLKFQSSNSTFNFCEWIHFVERKWSWLARREAIYVVNSHDWFQRLRNEGFFALRMSYGPSGEGRFPDRMLVGLVGGGGRWIIEAIGSHRCDDWEAHWELGDRDRADQKIWRVTYVRERGFRSSRRGAPADLEHLKRELRQSLQEIAEFSRSQQLDMFTAAFESGLSRLESQTPLEGLYHADIAPAGFLPLSANQLLASAVAAWVFGAMGSWNDLGFEGPAQARYEDLSEKLYQLLNRVIVAATNSAARDTPPS
jgi:hypothetical protein